MTEQANTRKDVRPTDFMTGAEFRELYGPEMSKKELVQLQEHDGTRLWKREPGGWRRLDNAPLEVSGG